MAIVFKHLKYKNFLSTGNLYTEIDLNRNRTTLILGENGSGKSTILDALTFVLFGKPYRPINIPQLLNSITKKQLLVEIEFSVGSNEYKVIRGLKPHVFEIYKNDELIDKSANNKDYQATLETQILKVNFKSFCQVVVLGSATFKPFMQLAAYERREVIENLLDLQIFTSMNSLLKNRIMMNGHRIIEANSSKKFIEEKIKIVKEHLLEIQNNNESIKEEKKERLRECKEKLQELYKNKQELLELEQTVEYNSEEESKKRKKLSQLESYKHKIEANIALLNKDNEFYQTHNDCPTCNQLIQDSFKKQKISCNTKKLEEYLSGIAKLKEEQSKLNGDLLVLKQAQNKLHDIRIKIITVQNKISSLEEYVIEIEKDINKITIGNQTEDTSKLDELQNELSVAEKEISTANSDKEVLMSASTLLKDSGIKAKIIKQYVPIINKLINKYLSALDFFVQFELNEEFKETIKSRYRDEFSYASFSEGEKMRINLAILFTWRAISKLRNSMNTNLLLMDEVFDSSLDGNGTDEFLKLLEAFTVDTNTFIISHKKDQLLEKFEHVIRFEKKQNFSRIQ